MIKGALSLAVSNPRTEDTKFSMTQEQDAALEHITDELDQVIKYSRVERSEILQFIRRKFWFRNQPFSSLPPLDDLNWANRKQWAMGPLEEYIIVGIGRFHRVSEHQKYILLAKLYGRVRDRMLPPQMILQSIEGD